MGSEECLTKQGINFIERRSRKKAEWRIHFRGIQMDMLLDRNEIAYCCNLTRLECILFRPFQSDHFLRWKTRPNG